MREVMFRGKRVDSKEWVYGGVFGIDMMRGSRYFIPHRHPRLQHSHIHLFDYTEIDPSTTGQYTGLKDSEGKLIFEGDIVKVKDMLSQNAPVITGAVEFDNGSFMIRTDYSTHYRWMDYEVKVVGNIHDNPELLESEG